MAINSTVTSTKEYIGHNSPDGEVIGLTTSSLVAFHGSTPMAQRAGAAQAAAPAGGSGATAGAYDTAANRDAAIALLNEIRAVLVEKGIMKGAA